MRETVDVTIIGGGPVGLFGSFYAGLRGMSVRIIDSLPELGGQLTALYPEKFVYDMPGFPQVLAKDLAANLAKQGTRFSPEVVLEETAQTLDREDDIWVVGGAKGEKYPTRTIIISAGAGAFSPTKLGVPDEESFVGKGLSYGVRSLAAYEGKDLVIVGGGDSAFDWAIGLHPIASRVRILHRRDQFKAHEESVIQAKNLGIEFMLWKAIKSIVGEDSVKGAIVTDTQTKEESEITCDSLVVNIGFKSSLGPLKDWGLNIEKNQISVDNLYRTNLSGIFAVGDVCSFDGKIKLIATGVGEAATAVCVAKMHLDPEAKLFPGHSSDMDVKPVA